MKIFCFGLSYRDHAIEMGFPIPTEPIVFMKPPTALLKPGEAFPYPPFSEDVEYETEIVLRMDKTGRNISQEEAKGFYSHLTVGIDFTARDLQRKLVKNGMPWEAAKGFDGSAFVGEFIPKPSDTRNIDFKLIRDGQTLQQGNTGNLIFTFEEVISHISKYFTIEAGDLMFTGSPVGTGDVLKTDKLEGFIGDQQLFTCNVV